jgi:hypothetical protein
MWVMGCSEDDGTSSKNQPPRLVWFDVDPASVILGGTASARAGVSDPDGDPLRYRWESTGGSFQDSTLSSTTWTAPDSAGTFTLTFYADDGIHTISTSGEVTVGNATLTVLSDPPGAGIELNSAFTGFVTPHTFTPLAPGTYDLRIESRYWSYERETAVVTLVHGDHKTEEFTLAAAESQPLDLGRRDLVEIGGLDFLIHGTGYVYAGRTAEGTGIFNSALNPQTGTPNGILLIPDVRVQESLAVTGSANPEIQHLFFVSAGDSLMVATLRDPDTDGIVDEVLDVRLLLDQTFGPAVSTTDQVAYSRTPSSDPPGQPLFWSQFEDSVFVGQATLATTRTGKMPTWEPGGELLAYVHEGVIFDSWYPDPFQVGDTLYAEGYNRAPDWGPWDPKHLAVVHGQDEMNLSEVRLVLRETGRSVAVAEGLVDPRYVAWSPVQKVLIVAHHRGGGAEVLLVTNLPVP